MKHYLFLLAVAAGFVLGGCDKDPDPATPKNVELSITFKALYNDTWLKKNTDYYFDDYLVQFSRFSTYLSDITLLNGTEEVKISDAEFIDFTPDGTATDSSVTVTIKAVVPEGNYTGFRMGYGVNPVNNAKQPSAFAAGSPLAQESEYWSGWGSYIFTKIEGQGDGDNNGQPDIFMVFHCGSDKVYRVYSYDKTITVSGNSAMSVEFDLKNMFYVDNAWYDMKPSANQYTSNNKNDTRVAAILMDNFDNATTIKQ